MKSDVWITLICCATAVILAMVFASNRQTSCSHGSGIETDGKSLDEALPVSRSMGVKATPVVSASAESEFRIPTAEISCGVTLESSTQWRSRKGNLKQRVEKRNVNFKASGSAATVRALWQNALDSELAGDQVRAKPGEVLTGFVALPSTPAYPPAISGA